MNSQIDGEQFTWLMRRFQKHMVALMAIEQLTGALKANPAALLASSDSLVVEKNQVRIEEMETGIAALAEEKAQLEGEKKTDEATIKETEMKKLQSELEELKKVRTRLASSASAGFNVFEASTSNRNDQAILQVAASVEKIVEQVMASDDFGTHCLINAKTDSITKVEGLKTMTAAACKGYLEKTVDLAAARIEIQRAYSEALINQINAQSDLISKIDPAKWSAAEQMRFISGAGVVGAASDEPAFVNASARTLQQLRFYNSGPASLMAPEVSIAKE